MSTTFNPAVDSYVIAHCERFFPKLFGSYFLGTSTKTGALSIASKLQALNGPFGSDAQWIGIRHPLSNHIIAFCTVGESSNMCFIYNVAVLEEYRRQGWAKKLLQQVIDKWGTKDLYLFVDRSNRPAIALYRQFNFEFDLNTSGQSFSNQPDHDEYPNYYCCSDLCYIRYATPK